jgi:hypothetical protein
VPDFKPDPKMISQADQSGARLVALVPVLAQFYNALIEKGFPASHAIYLTNTYLNSCCGKGMKRSD